MAKAKVVWTPERRAAFSRAQKARWAARKREAAREMTVGKDAEGSVAEAQAPARPIRLRTLIRSMRRPVPVLDGTLFSLETAIEWLEPGEELLVLRLA